MTTTDPTTLVVRLGPCEHLLCCDFCFKNETVDCHRTGKLRPMYRLDDDLIICQRCLDAGKHNTPLQVLERSDNNLQAEVRQC